MATRLAGTEARLESSPALESATLPKKRMEDGIDAAYLFELHLPSREGWRLDAGVGFLRRDSAGKMARVGAWEIGDLGGIRVGPPLAPPEEGFQSPDDMLPGASWRCGHTKMQASSGANAARFHHPFRPQGSEDGTRLAYLFELRLPSREVGGLPPW